MHTAGYPVLGYDVDPAKVTALTEGTTKTKKAKLEECTVQTKVHNVTVLPAGNSVRNPLTLLTAPQFLDLPVGHLRSGSLRAPDQKLEPLLRHGISVDTRAAGLFTGFSDLRCGAAGRASFLCTLGLVCSSLED